MNWNYLVYVLVGGAAAAFGYVLWQVLVGVGDSRGADLDWRNAANPTAKQPKPMDRFVTPGRLFRMRVVFAALPALVIPAVFLMSGFDNPFFLAAFALLFAVFGWNLPPVHFRRLLRKRQEAFEDRILDLTLSCANALKSGMALPQAIDRIRLRMKGPMREELDTLHAEYGLGIDLGESFARLTERMPCEDMMLLTASVRLTMRTGGSLADVLAEMAETIRRRRELHDKVKTLTAGGRLEGLVLSLMPVVAFIAFYIIQPEMTKVLVTTMIGWTMLGVSAVLIVIGYLVINAISKVEV